MDDRIRLITDEDEAKALGVRVGDHVRIRKPDAPFMLVPAAAEPDTTPSTITAGDATPIVTDEELEAASLAYVQARFAGEACQWRRSFPEAWRELTERMRVALIAAAGVRAS